MNTLTFTFYEVLLVYFFATAAVSYIGAKVTDLRAITSKMSPPPTSQRCFCATAMNSHLSLLSNKLELICFDFVDKSCVIWAGHMAKVLRFSQRDALRVRAWNLVLLMFNNYMVRLQSKMIENWGTRGTFVPLNITYISPLFLALFKGSFKVSARIAKWIDLKMIGSGQ